MLGDKHCLGVGKLISRNFEQLYYLIPCIFVLLLCLGNIFCVIVYLGRRLEDCLKNVD